MPFTLTHILAVVPIASVKRQPMPFSALLIGSMIPDFPMFAPDFVGLSYSESHSIVGLFIVCLPLGLASYLAFHTLMKRPLFALLPVAVQRRCASLAAAKLQLTFRTIFWAAVAIVVGAATHLLWDSFSHADRWGTRLLPSLNHRALTFGPYGLTGYKVVQYGSSVIGLPLLAFLLVRTLRRRPIEPLDGLPRLSATQRVRVCVAIGVGPLLVGLATAGATGLSTYLRVGATITRAGCGLLVATLVYCVTFHAIRRAAARQGLSQ